MTAQDREVMSKFSGRLEELESETVQRLKGLEIAVKGNGTLGLGDRMTASEGWQDKHEEAHRLFVEDNHAYRIEREKKEVTAANKKTKAERAKNIRAYSFMGSGVLAIVVLFLKTLMGGG